MDDIMTTPLPETLQSAHALFKIKGRMIPFAEFPLRLDKFSKSLGISSAKSHVSTWPAGGEVAEHASCGEGTDEVCVLSAKVKYNRNWGGRCWLPRRLDKSMTEDSPAATPAHFIAPFLNLYREAQENIFISQTPQDQCLITLSENITAAEGEGSKYRVVLHLEKFVQPDKDGNFRPLASCNQHSYRASVDFHQTVSGFLEEWMLGRKLAIGKYLSSQLFSFEVADGEIDGNNPFVETILPHIAEIVTHPTPNLRAAEIHLQKIFLRDTKRLALECRLKSRNLLCIAGLDIDMTAVTGEEKSYFVPWQAHVTLAGKEPGQEYSLDQDDLFLQLMK